MMNNNWEQLYSASEQLTQATSIHNVFSDEDIAFVEQRLKSVLRRFLEKGELHKGFKVYVDQKLDNSYIKKMAAQTPSDDESIRDWCMSIFGDQKFGFIFNSLESYDNKLVERMCTIVHPLLEKAGMPLGGLSFLFFMGNYGFTPFGIHKEAKGEEGFLFHMGPSPKTFYTWDIEEYNAIEHNTEVFHNVAEMLPLAESYELSPQSVMFIPNHLYHIANTDEFSFSVVMDYINPSRHALETMIAQNIADEMKDSAKNKSYLSPISLGNGLEKSVTKSESSWEEKYNHTLERYIARLKSNSGILLPAIPEVGNYIAGDQFKITGKKLFPLLEYKDLNEQSYVMVRGREIPVEKNSKLSSVLETLNAGEWVSFEELQKSLMGDWELHHIFSFVSDLLEFDAIEMMDQ